MSCLPRRHRPPSRLVITTQAPGPLAAKVKAIFYEAQLVQLKHLVEKPQVLCKQISRVFLKGLWERHGLALSYVSKRTRMHPLKGCVSLYKSALSNSDKNTSSGVRETWVPSQFFHLLAKRRGKWLNSSEPQFPCSYSAWFSSFFFLRAVFLPGYLYESRPTSWVFTQLSFSVMHSPTSICNTSALLTLFPCFLFLLSACQYIIHYPFYQF